VLSAVAARSWFSCRMRSPLKNTDRVSSATQRQRQLELPLRLELVGTETRPRWSGPGGRVPPGSLNRAESEVGVWLPADLAAALPDVALLQVDLLLGRVCGVEALAVGVVERADVVPLAFEVRQAVRGEGWREAVSARVPFFNVLVLRVRPRSVGRAVPRAIRRREREWRTQRNAWDSRQGVVYRV